MSELSTSTPTPLTYDVQSAARRLGPVVTPDWLRHNISRLPHVRSGKGRGRSGRIAFTEAHLAEIVLMLEQRPAEMPPAISPSDFSSVVSKRRRAS